MLDSRREKGDKVAAPNGNCSIRALHKIQVHPAKLALWSVKHGRVSFAQLGEQAAARQSDVRRQGLNPGDAVVVMALPSPDLYATLVALMGLGCPILFIEPWMPARQIDHVLNRIQPKLMFADLFGRLWKMRNAMTRELPCVQLDGDKLKAAGHGQLEIRAVDPGTPAIISVTSGTTGSPKGVVRTHEYMWNLHEILEKYGGDRELDGPDLTVFPNLVLYHIGTGRGSLLVPSNWSISTLEKVRTLEKDLWPQSLACGPAFLRRLLDHNLLLPSLRSVHVGGALVECELLEIALKALPRAKILQVYGGTEVEPVATCDARVSLENSRAKGYVHALNVGFPIEEIKTQWDEQGTLWVSGPNVCAEYIDNEVENRLHKRRDESGTLWHCMNDRIIMDDKGLWYAGRASQSFEDFIFEQKLYAKIGHTRAFLHRDALGQALIIADDDRERVKRAGAEINQSAIPVWSSAILRDKRHRSRIDRQATWMRSLRMQRWLTYVKERSPLAVLFILSLGPVVSGYFLSRVHGQCSEDSAGCLPVQPSAAVAALAVLCSIFFMVLARMMDELKDFEKDKLANPSRPLPRGLISPEEMNTAIRMTFALVVLLSAAFLLLSAPLSALLFAASSIYLWLMYKEFYVGTWLNRFPLAYALSHQIVGVPLYLFGITLFAPWFAQDGLAWVYVGLNVSASISYEFSRKLKPDAHPAANTYRQIYGLKKAGLIALVFQLVGMALTATTMSLGLTGSFLLLVLQGVFLMVLVLHILRDGLHKLTEGCAALVVLGSAWLGVLALFRI